MVVKLQISNTSGADLGPFNLTADVGSVVPSTATRSELIAGLDVTVDNAATSITLTSTGDCTNDKTVTISGVPVTTYCYEIETVQSSQGECFDCPGFFASSTDTFIKFYDGCGGTQIPAPTDINISVTYSDSSTSGSFIPAGKSGSVLIAYSDVQCAALPSCGEIASPEFTSVDVTTLGGLTVTECCTGPAPTTTTTTTAAPTTTTTTTAAPTTTTTTTAATTTTTTTAAPACYVYEYINNNPTDTIDVNGTLCGGGAYSQPVPPAGEGSTSCIQELSQAVIDAYAAQQLILTRGATTCT